MKEDIIIKLIGDKYILCNEKGVKILPYEYDFIHFEGDSVLLSKKGKVKKISLKDFFNKIGNKARLDNANKIEVKHDLIYYIFKDDNKVGVCDKQGDIIIEPIYDKIERYTGVLFGKYYECYKGKKIDIYDEKTMKKCFDFEYTDAYTCANKCAVFYDGYTNVFYDFETSNIIYNNFEKIVPVKILYKEGKRSHRYEDEKCCSVIFFKNKIGGYYKVYDTDTHQDITKDCEIKIKNDEGIVIYRNEKGRFKGEITNFDWGGRGRNVLFPFGTWWKQENKQKKEENQSVKRR